MRTIDPDLAASARKIRMHHAPLNRPRTNDRHLDDEIIKPLGPKPRQHGHLRPTLNLKNTHRVGPTKHLINGWILSGNRGQGRERIPVGHHHRQRFADTREHPKSQNIDFEKSKSLQIILVPWDHRAPGHASRLDRSHLMQRTGRQDESTDMDR